MPLEPAPPGNSYHQVKLPGGGTTLEASGTQLLQAYPEETLSRRLHLNHAGLLLLTANFSIFQTKQRFYVSGSGLLLIAADYSAPADQTQRILKSKYAMA